MGAEVDTFAGAWEFGIEHDLGRLGEPCSAEAARERAAIAYGKIAF